MKEHQLPDILLRSIRSGIVPVVPDRVNIKITGVCNLHCEFCEYHSFLNVKKPKPVHVDAGGIISVIGELARGGCRDVTLCACGEPSLHPQFADIVAAVKQGGMRLCLVTNLSLTSKTVRLAYQQADRILVNVSAWDESSYRAIHFPEIPETFLHVLENIRSLDQRHCQLDICCVITKHNFCQVEKVLSLAETCGAGGVQFRNINVDPPTRGLALSVAERRELALKIAYLLQGGVKIRNNMKEMLKELVMPETTTTALACCWIGWLMLSIEVDGSLFLCPQNKRLKIGRLTPGRMSSLWSGVKAHRLRLLARDHIQRQEVSGGYCRHCPFAGLNEALDKGMARCE